MPSALALEKRREVGNHAVRHFVTEVMDDCLEKVHFHNENEQSLARILMLCDVLEVIDKANLIVGACKRVRSNSVF